MLILRQSVLRMHVFSNAHMTHNVISDQEHVHAQRKASNAHMTHNVISDQEHVHAQRKASTVLMPFKHIHLSDSVPKLHFS